MARPVSITFHGPGGSTAVWVSPGMSVGELESTLCAAFDIPEGDIVGLMVEGLGRYVHLSHVPKDPAAFAAFRGIRLVVSAEDTDGEDDDDDDYDDDDESENENDDENDDEDEEEEYTLNRELGNTGKPEAEDQFVFTSEDISIFVKLFKRFAPEGRLNRGMFSRIFSVYLQEKYQGDQQRTALVLHKLFQKFDRDQNGEIDAREFLSGLTVLSSGDRDEKIKIAFDMYDKDGNGFIELSEMQSYLVSVFTVIQETTPDVFKSQGATPVQLAQVTAQQCFAEADTNRDGRLTFDEFRQWYTTPKAAQYLGTQADLPQAPVQFSNSSNGLSLAAAASSSPEIGLTGLSQRLGFNKLHADTVFNVFTKHAEHGGLNSDQFFKAYKSLVEEHHLDVDPSAARAQLLQLFNWFDQDSNGMVDFEELGSAMSLLCTGTRDERVLAAWRLYDQNGQGFITVDEMITYMTSVFVLLFQSSPSVRQSMGGVEASELAELTARQCFEEADVAKTGRLTFDQFRMWYLKPTSSIVNSNINIEGTQPPAGSLASQNIGLDQIRELTGIANLEIFVVFDQFAKRVDERGYLSWVKFQESFEAIRQMAGVQHSGHDDVNKFQIILRRLFTLFDNDGNGVVDFTELCSGLGVISRNHRAEDDKVRATFSLFDANGDGFIDLEEMERYLTSLYRVMFDISPGASARSHGLDPGSLAKITTMDCFQRADMDRDGKLSYAEFTRWFVTDQTQNAQSQVVTATRRSAPGPSLYEIRKLTGLDNLEVEDACELLSEAIEPGTEGLKRTMFQKVFHEMADPNVDRNRLTQILNHLFDAFDANENGEVSFQELVCGLSILCDGGKDEKAVIAFELFDANGDGFLSIEELGVYFKAVFRILYISDPQGCSKRAGGLTADQLAEVTTTQVFQSADLDQNNRLSFEEFEIWYNSNQEKVEQKHGSKLSATEPVKVSVQSASSLSSSSSSSGSNPEYDTMRKSAPWMSLQVVRRLTFLERYKPEEAFEALAEVANEDGVLDKKAFFRAFQGIVRQQGGLEDAEDREKLRFVLHRLFDTFDTDGNGLVDFAELSSGLSILSGGSQDDKARSAFQLIDVNGDGRISMEEMTRYLSCVFAVMFETSPETRAQVNGASAQELAHSTAEKVFVEADLDGNGKLDLQEFRKWYSQGTGRNLSVAADLMAQDPDWFTTDEIRRLTKLDEYDSREVFEWFADALGGNLSPNDVISREQFDEVMENLTNDEECATEDDFVRLTFIKDRLYDIFDTNGDGEVNISELSAGLLVLCSGTRDDKIETCFGLFDLNGDGVITESEMAKLLASTYKVMYSTRPEIRERMGATTPEELAKATAYECFREADVNNDGHVTLEEFKTWVAKPSGKAVTEMLDAAPAFVSIEEIRKLTRIDQYEAEQVRNQIVEYANENGEVAIKGFKVAFREIAAAALDEGETFTAEQQRHLNSVLERLFAIFDADKNGLVDSRELSAGLVILCGGDRDEKARVAFAEFDYDGNNRISLQEMSRYLESIFRVMYETKPETAETVGASPAELAQATAEQIFLEADLDANGELDFDEFKRYYSSAGGAALAEIKETVPQWLSLDDIRKLTRLELFTPAEVFEAFARNTKNGELDRLTFETSFMEVASSSGPPLSVVEKDRLPLIIHRLFDAFDTSQTGKVEYLDIIAGLSVLCGGTKELRASSAFSLYDLDGDGFVQKEELKSYLAAVYTVLFELQQGAREQMGGVSPEELAHVTTDKLFLDYDSNQDGKLSYSEFKRWFECTQPAPPNGALRSPQNPTQLSDNNTADESEDQDEDEDSDGESDEDSVAPEQSEDHGFDRKKDQASLEASTNIDLGLEAGSSLALYRLSQIAGLYRVFFRDALELFAQKAGKSGDVSKSAFQMVFSEVAEKFASPLIRDVSEMKQLVDTLFGVFQNNKGTVDFVEVASALSLVCGGPRGSKAEVIFHLFEHDGSGAMSISSLEWFLASIYKLVYATRPGVRQRVGDINPEELAVLTARHIYEELGILDTNMLKVDDFKRWYLSNSSSAAVVNSIDGRDGGLATLRLGDLRRITGLEFLSQNVVFEEFAMAVDEDGALSSDNFHSVFSHLVGMSPKPSSDHYLLPSVLDYLFDVFDTNKDSRVDFSEFAAGISILCKDSQDDKARAAFSLFDENDDGKISKDELVRYLSSVYRLVYAANPEVKSTAGGLSPSELAASTADEIFTAFAAEGENTLSFDAFKKWYDIDEANPIFACDVAKSESQVTSSSKVEVASRNDNNTVPPNEARTESKASDIIERGDWMTLSEVRRVTGFGAHDVHELFEAFATRTNDEGQLTREAFEAAFDSLVPRLAQVTKRDAQKITVIRGRLFDIFDVDDNGVVDFTEIAAGLSVLTGGDIQSRCDALFSLFDLNQDKILSRDEMERFLLDVFRVVYEVEPQTVYRAGGASPQELATNTVAVLFEEFDLGENDGLSEEQFTEWFHRARPGSVQSMEKLSEPSPKNEEKHNRELPAPSSSSSASRPPGLGDTPPKVNPPPGMGPTALKASEHPDEESSRGSDEPVCPAVSKDYGEAAKPVKQDLALDETRRVTGLGELASDVVFSKFAEVTDESGCLSQQDFSSTFREIAVMARGAAFSDEDEHLFALVLERLQKAFDQEGSGKIDFADLCSGLSIFTKGDREDRVSAAFQLYDVDGDGFISQEEILSFLSAIFVVIFSLTPSKKEDMSKTVAQIAEDTAREALAEADHDGDGLLSVDEFSSWFAEHGDEIFHVSPAEDDDFSPMSPCSPAFQASTAGSPTVSHVGGLSEIRRLTKLGNVEVQDVLRLIEEREGDQPLDFAAFVSIFEELIEVGGGHECYNDQQAASAVVRQLFELFDSNKDGKVDTMELVSGLSVLCKGTSEEKVQAAFDLYDLDGDGMISLEEMTHYLTSVYRVLYAAQQDSSKAFGVSPEMLSAITAESCFLERDTDGDGKLSRQEFEAWYAQANEK